MADYGIKLGTNAWTDSDLDLQFTSKYSSLKIYKWGNASFTTDGSGVGSVTINHNLGYAPMSVVFVKYTASNSLMSGATTYANAFSHLGGFNLYNGGYNGGLEQISIITEVSTTSITIKNTELENNLQASTTYNFRYYILVDKSQTFTDASNVSQTSDIGFKVATSGKDVFSSPEHELAYSSKYKALQYYRGHIKSASLTLPTMFASPYDTTQEEGTYVDFNHSLGYAPFFLAYFQVGSGNFSPIPYNEIPADVFPTYQYSVNGFSDSSRIRVYFWRRSDWSGGDLFGNYAESTITIKVIMFAENLLGAESP